MAESLGSAVLDLTTDASDLESGLSSAESTTKSRMSRMGGVIKKGGAMAAGAFVAVGGAAIGAAFKTAAMGDEIGKTAPKLGVSTDALQEMRYWADRNGISSSGMERAVGRLNQRIGDGTEGSSKYVDALNDMGVATLDMNGNVRDTESVMRDAISALSDIESPSERSAAAAELFGTKMARDLMPALEDGSLSMEEAAAAAHELGLVMDGEAIESAERFQDAWADIKDAGAAMLRDFGTPVMEFLVDKLFPAIQEHVIPALQAFGEWIGPKLAAAADWVGDFFENTLVPAFHRLSDWWEEYGPAIIAYAETMWEGLKTVFEAVREAWDTVVGLFQSGGDDTTGVFAEIQEFAQEVWPKVQGIIESVMDAINAVIERVTAIVQGIWERWGDDILGHLETVWEAIKSVISGALDVIEGIFEIFAGLFSGDWDRLWEGVKQVAEGLWDIIAGLWDTLVSTLELAATVLRDTITELWENLWEWVKGKAAEIWDNIVDTVSGAIDDVIDWVKGLPDRVKDAVSDAGEWLVEAGKEVIRGMLSGITSMFGRIGETMGNVASRVRSFLPFSPAKEGPLRDNPPDEAGAKIAEMLADGLASGVGDVTASMSRLVNLDVGGGDGASMPSRHLDVTINNPLPEAASDSLVRHLRRLEAVGVFDD